MSEHIPVFCATDENYAPFASIMMKSVLMHTNSFVDFYVMDGGIKERTKKHIEKDLKKYPNKKLHFVDMSKYDLAQFPDLVYYSVNTFSRYFIPDIAPKLLKIIYLDVDVIVKRDIADLFNQNLENYPMAAMPESIYFDLGSQKRLKKEVWTDYGKDSPYFNAGVLLLNVQKLIAMDFTKKAIELTAELYHKVSCPDQDVLNILFENNYKQLDASFDYMVFYQNQYKKVVSKSIDPMIIHYAVFKPWKENSPFQEDFEEVLRTSVFYKRVVKKYRSKKISKFYLFGFIPLFTRVVLKKI